MSSSPYLRSLAMRFSFCTIAASTTEVSFGMSIDGDWSRFWLCFPFCVEVLYELWVSNAVRGGRDDGTEPVLESAVVLPWEAAALASVFIPSPVDMLVATLEVADET